MRVAVILTTYNRPDALAAVLDGYSSQDTLDFELIVADDGSRSDTRELVEARARRAPFPLRHVWQEDRGFRAGGARNRALTTTSAEYVIFSDGDCVPPAAFVARHRALAEPGYFVAATASCCRSGSPPPCCAGSSRYTGGATESGSPPGSGAT